MKKRKESPVMAMVAMEEELLLAMRKARVFKKIHARAHTLSPVTFQFYYFLQFIYFQKKRRVA